MEYTALPYKRQGDLFAALTAGGEHFFSERILLLMVDRCRWILGEADTLRRNNGMASGLLSLFQKFATSEQIYLVRLAPVRYEIERLSKKFGEIRELDLLAMELEATFRDFSVGIGYDNKLSLGQNILIDSYPLVTLAYDEKDCSSTGESGLLRKYFYEVYQGEFAAGLSFEHFNEKQLSLVLKVLETFTYLNQAMIVDIACHVRHICLMRPIDQDIAAFSAFNFSSRYLLGACFISERIASNYAYLFEAIYHEALHMKFFNTILTHQMFKDDRNSTAPPQFECPWIRTGTDQLWHLDRVFAAFHVYIHLHVLYALLLYEVRIDAISTERIIERLSVSDKKGHILMHWLDEHLPSVLTSEGIQFYSTLRNIFLHSVHLHSLQHA